MCSGAYASVENSRAHVVSRSAPCELLLSHTCACACTAHAQCAYKPSVPVKTPVKPFMTNKQFIYVYIIHVLPFQRAIQHAWAVEEASHTPCMDLPGAVHAQAHVCDNRSSHGADRDTICAREFSTDA